MTFFETVFGAEAVILSLYFAIVSIVEALSERVFVSQQLKWQAKFSAWYLLAVTVLTLFIIYIQAYFPNGVLIGKNTLALDWIFGGGAAFLVMVLLAIGLVLILRLALSLMQKIGAAPSTSTPPPTPT